MPCCTGRWRGKPERVIFAAEQGAPSAPYSMSKKSVFCIATSHQQADQIGGLLKLAGFADTDISVLLPDEGVLRDFAHEIHTKAPEGALTGGVVGGALGWVAGLGALAIPGFGPYLAAGPVLMALSGAAVGATVGGITGGLIGLGIPEIQAKCYEGKVKAGNVLIAVHTDDFQEVNQAEGIFRHAGARDVHTTYEAAVPDGKLGAVVPKPVVPVLLPLKSVRR